MEDFEFDPFVDEEFAEGYEEWLNEMAYAFELQKAEEAIYDES